MFCHVLLVNNYYMGNILYSMHSCLPATRLCVEFACSPRVMSGFPLTVQRGELETLIACVCEFVCLHVLAVLATVYPASHPVTTARVHRLSHIIHSS